MVSQADGNLFEAYAEMHRSRLLTQGAVINGWVGIDLRDTPDNRAHVGEAGGKCHKAACHAAHGVLNSVLESLTLGAADGHRRR